MSFLMALTACAGIAPVPGGSDMVNQSFYGTREELLQKMQEIQPGMTEKEVLQKLGRGKNDLVRLERSGIVTALYGSNSVEFRDGPDSQDGGAFLQSLYGYRLDYKIVSRKHGFTSPIRIRTDEKGFDYRITLVFQNGILYAAPILTGGTVNKSSSSTFFDYLTPGAILSRTAP